MNGNFTERDMEHEQFIKIPLVLLKNSYYKGLSNDARIAYGILLDRLKLSYSNRKDWTDEEGRVYIVYTNEELCDILGKSKPTVVNIKKELEKFGLLIERRQGVQKPNLLYPQKVRSKKSLLQEVKNFNFKGKKILTLIRLIIIRLIIIRGRSVNILIV